MSFLPPFIHHRPLQLEEALDLVSVDDVPYSGGTELLLAMKTGLLRPDSLVDLKRISDLSEIAVDDGDLIIGGSATHHSVASSRIVADTVPVLAEVASQVGNPRVRSVGTIGGNLCFAEPRSDIATLLMGLSGRVRLRSSRAERDVAVADFVVGPYTTVREEDEILTQVRIPIVPGQVAVYEQFKFQERPTVGVAAIRLEDGLVRVVVGAVGGVAEQFEGRLADLDPTEISRSVDVIADIGGPERYKRHLTEVLIRRAMERIGADS